jgi:hypothetical protein
LYFGYPVLYFDYPVLYFGYPVLYFGYPVLYFGYPVLYFGYPVLGHLGFLLPKTFKLFGFERHLMKDILETCRTTKFDIYVFVDFEYEDISAVWNRKYKQHL